MLIKKTFYLICFVFTLVFSFAASASSNIYFTSIEVPNYDYKEKVKAFNSGLNDILVKVSVNPKVKNNEKIKETLKRKVKVSSLVYKSHYRVMGDKLFLDIQFRENRVNKLLSDFGFRVIKSKRPKTMLWLAHEYLHGSNIINVEQQPLIEKKLSSISDELGVSLMLPILDLEDRQQVALDDILNFNFEKLTFNAKNKYGAECVLAGNYYKLEDKLYFKWHLHSNSVNTNWESHSVSLEEEINKVVEHIAEYMLEKEQMKIHEPIVTENNLDIFVSGINSVEKYTFVENYLRKLMLIKNVELKEINSDKALFSLKTDSSKEDIVNALKLDRILVENLNSPSVISHSDIPNNVDIKINGLEDSFNGNNNENNEENIEHGVMEGVKKGIQTNVLNYKVNS